MLRRERAALAPGFDIVINPRRAVLTGDFEALRNELRELLGDLVRRP
jgi:RNase P protein component